MTTMTAVTTTELVADALLQVLAEGRRAPPLRFSAEQSPLVIGRAPEVDIVLADPSVSRRHAQLRAYDGAWWVDDLGSANGVRIDGRRSSGAQRLLGGEWLGFGDVFCVFELAGAAPIRAASGSPMTPEAWSLRLRNADEPDELLATLLAGAVELARCHRGLLLAANADGSFTTVASFGHSHERLEREGFAGSSAVLKRCIASREPVLVDDLDVSDWVRGRPSVVADGLRRLLAWPLERDGALLGVITMDARMPAGPLPAIDMDLIGGFTSEAAAILRARGIESALASLASCLAVDAKGTAAGTVPVLRWRP